MPGTSNAAVKRTDRIPALLKFTFFSVGSRERESVCVSDKC